MNIEEIREYCIAKPGVTEGFPFNDTADPNLTVIKYEVNRITLAGSVDEVSQVSEREGEASVANFPKVTIEVYSQKDFGFIDFRF